MSEINLTNMSNIFELENSIKEDTKDLVKSINNLPDNINEESSEDIIRENIDNARELFDLVMQQIQHGNLTAGLAQSAATIINAITNAANSIQTVQLNDFNMELKERSLSIKEEELKLKIKDAKNPQNQTNILVVDTREKVLQALKDVIKLETKPLESEENIIEI